MQILLDNEITPVCGGEFVECICYNNNLNEHETTYNIDLEQCKLKCCIHTRQYELVQYITRDNGNKMTSNKKGLCERIRDVFNYNNGCLSDTHAFEYPLPDCLK